MGEEAGGFERLVEVCFGHLQWSGGGWLGSYALLPARCALSNSLAQPGRALQRVVRLLGKPAPDAAAHRSAVWA